MNSGFFQRNVDGSNGTAQSSNILERCSERMYPPKGTETEGKQVGSFGQSDSPLFLMETPGRRFRRTAAMSGQ